MKEDLHSHDGYLLTWSNFCANKGAPDRKACAHHRCCIGGGNDVRDLEGEVLVCANMA